MPRLGQTRVKKRVYPPLAGGSNVIGRYEKSKLESYLDMGGPPYDSLHVSGFYDSCKIVVRK